MTNDVKKEDLVNKAFDLGLGTKEFLTKCAVDNLVSMIATVEGKDLKIKDLEKAAGVSDGKTKMTRVSDIIKAGHIKVVGDGK